MNHSDALALADSLLSLINSTPRTPTREEMAEVIQRALLGKPVSRRGVITVMGDPVLVKAGGDVELTWGAIAAANFDGIDGAVSGFTWTEEVQATGIHDCPNKPASNCNAFAKRADDGNYNCLTCDRVVADAVVTATIAADRTRSITDALIYGMSMTRYSYADVVAPPIEHKNKA